MPSQRPEEEVEPAGKYGVAESYVRQTGPGKEGDGCRRRRDRIGCSRDG